MPDKSVTDKPDAAAGQQPGLQALESGRQAAATAQRRWGSDQRPAHRHILGKF